MCIRASEVNVHLQPFRIVMNHTLLSTLFSSIHTRARSRNISRATSSRLYLLNIATAPAAHQISKFAMSPKRSPRRGRRPNSPAQPPRSTALLKYEFVSPASMLEHGDLLKEDLHSFGFAKEAIQRMLKKPEPVVDSFAQVVHGSYARLREERERKREAFDRKNAARKRRKGSEEGSPKGRKGEQQIYLDRPGGSEYSWKKPARQQLTGARQAGCSSIPPRAGRRPSRSHQRFMSGIATSRQEAAKSWRTISRVMR